MRFGKRTDADGCPLLIKVTDGCLRVCVQVRSQASHVIISKRDLESLGNPPPSSRARGADPENAFGFTVGRGGGRRTAQNQTDESRRGMAQAGEGGRPPRRLLPARASCPSWATGTLKTMAMAIPVAGGPDRNHLHVKLMAQDGAIAHGAAGAAGGRMRWTRERAARRLPLRLAAGAVRGSFSRGSHHSRSNRG